MLERLVQRSGGREDSDAGFTCKWRADEVISEFRLWSAEREERCFVQCSLDW